jgi:hypothetical protein
MSASAAWIECSAAERLRLAQRSVRSPTSTSHRRATPRAEARQQTSPQTWIARTWPIRQAAWRGSSRGRESFFSRSGWAGGRPRGVAAWTVGGGDVARWVRVSPRTPGSVPVRATPWTGGIPGVCRRESISATGPPYPTGMAGSSGACIPKEPPEDWWMDLGDLANNARQALDHLVLQLALDSGSTPNKDRTQFPIFEVENDYLRKRGRNPSHRDTMLAGVASRHRRLIDDAQPYKWGSNAADHPLAMLRSLTDRHKHREQHVGAAFLAQFQVTHQYAGGVPQVRGVATTIGHFQNPDPVLDNDVIHAVYPTQEPEEDFTLPQELIDKGWPDLGAMRGDRVGLETTVPPRFTVGFFGERPFKIENIAEIPPT